MQPLQTLCHRAFGTVLWELMTWCGAGSWPISCAHCLWCHRQLALPPLTFAALLPRCRHVPFENLNPFQIINLVQRSGASCLEVPPPNTLPAGQLGGYSSYVALMQQCWAQHPADRPHFEEVGRFCCVQ